MTARNIILNGKFLSAAPTGVHRVALELGNALADLVAEEHASVRDLNFALSVPADGYARANEVRLPSRLVRPFRGIPWEQISLPFSEREATILNLCNIGPVIARNAVTMIHDVQVHLSPESYSRGFRLWYRTLQPIMARRHRHILTVSEFSRQEIAKAGLCALDHISVVHNGVDHILRMKSDASAVAKLDLSAAPYVLALSTVQAHKNIGILMKAFADPALVGVKLVLFGGTSRAAFAASGIAVPQNVIFAGRVTDNELRGLIEGARCLAFPSTTEGFGLPPLEAMLLGCPAIVAPCGALPEVCGDAVLYCAPDDVGDWVKAIRSVVFENRLRAHLSKAGADHAAQFTWRRAAIELAKILTRL
jgi:glycosyltransferase involved in cell wall biosynthesis